jgi:hypothetical protein
MSWFQYLSAADGKCLAGSDRSLLPLPNALRVMRLSDLKLIYNCPTFAGRMQILFPDAAVQRVLCSLDPGLPCVTCVLWSRACLGRCFMHCISFDYRRKGRLINNAH